MMRHTNPRYCVDPEMGSAMRTNDQRLHKAVQGAVAKAGRPISTAARGLSLRELGEADALAQRSERAQHLLAFYGGVNGHPREWAKMPKIARIRAVLVDLGQLSADHGVRLEDLIA